MATRALSDCWVCQPSSNMANPRFSESKAESYRAGPLISILMCTHKHKHIQKKKTEFKSSHVSPVVWYLSGMHKTLNLTPSTTEINNKSLGTG